MDYWVPSAESAGISCFTIASTLPPLFPQPPNFDPYRDGVYEEVNKSSLAKHYIGLHNESTFKKTATYQPQLPHQIFNSVFTITN